MSFLSHILPWDKKSPLNPTHIVHEVEDKINRLTNGALDRVEHAVENEVKKVIGDVEGVIVEGLVAIGDEASKPALGVAAAITSEIDKGIDKLHISEHDKELMNQAPFIIGLNVGPASFTLYWHGVFERLDHIHDRCKHYQSKGIGKKRHEIIEAIKDFGPDAIDFQGGFKFSIGVEIGVQCGVWSFPMEVAVELLDDLMKSAGVPA